MPKDKTTVVLLFGGPGVEHNISASTLKPWVTTLDGASDIALQVYFLRAASRPALSGETHFVYPKVEWWDLPKRFLYANTCEDFSSPGQLNEAGSSPLNDDDLRERLRDATVISLVHGMYGEDGVLAEKLRQLVGDQYKERVLLADECALHRTFDKVQTHAILADHGLGDPSNPLIKIPIPVSVYQEQSQSLQDGNPANSEMIELARKVHSAARTLVPVTGRIVMKPARGGSSFGVNTIQMASMRPPDFEALWDPIRQILKVSDNLPFDNICHCGQTLKESYLLVEPHYGGETYKEFSVITLGRDFDGALMPQPIALCPTSITALPNQVFDTRQKGLYGAGTRLETPGNFDGRTTLDTIRQVAGHAHKIFGLDVMARIDGFVTTESGMDRIVLTDINAIAGMTSASFSFVQAAHIGLNHEAFVRYLVRSKSPGKGVALLPGRNDLATHRRARAVNVVLGGATSERDVSRQSGFFAGLCLATGGLSTTYTLMDRSGSFTPIGLLYALHHQVDQIDVLIDDSYYSNKARSASDRILQALDPTNEHPQLRQLRDDYLRIGTRERGGKHLTLHELLRILSSESLPVDDQVSDVPLFLFLALHGGIGEDGTIQSALELFGVPYNGSGPQASSICADKILANRVIDNGPIEGVGGIPTISLTRMELFDVLRTSARASFSKYINEWRRDGHDPKGLVLKPNSDGSSTSVFVCRSEVEFESAMLAVLRLSPGGVHAATAARASANPDSIWLLQPALIDEQTPVNMARDRDSLRVWFRDRRYVELTVGVLEAGGDGDQSDRARSLRGLEPTVTVAKGTFLTLEEKFQQGWGENIPLRSFEVPDQTVESITERARQTALLLNIDGYARLDFIYDRSIDRLNFLEANTLCALTDATVFFSQAYDRLKMNPVHVLGAIIEAGIRRHELKRL